MSRSALFAGLALMAAASATPVMAAPDSGRDHAVTSASVDAGAAVAAVHTAGYTAVREVEWERGYWQVKASDSSGHRVNLHVDATSGAVTKRGH